LEVGLFDRLIKSLGHHRDSAEQRLIEAFNEELAYLFREPRYLIQALTHRSYMRSGESVSLSNERLEYLGDSILGMIIAEYLYSTYPDYAEGDLTKTKALLVNEGALSLVGKDSGLSNLIFLSPEEERSGGRSRSSIISDAVEAVIGAIYIDGGLNAARDFVHRVIISRQSSILADLNQHNFKGDLLEYLQARGEVAPSYEVLSEEGPDHDKTFKIAAHARGKITGLGVGQSKKEAEQKAAAAALDNLRRENPTISPSGNNNLP